MSDSQPRRGITLTREQLEEWSGRRLTDDEIDRLEDAIPNSSIPQAIDAIVSEAISDAISEAVRRGSDDGEPDGEPPSVPERAWST